MEIGSGLFDLWKQAALVLVAFTLVSPVVDRYERLRRPLIAAVFLGATAATIQNAVPLGGGVVADLRGALLLSSMIYGGRLVGTLTLVFAELHRFSLGGGGVTAGLVGNALASLVGLMIPILVGRRPNARHVGRITIVVLGAACVVITTNLAYLFIRPTDLAIAVWTHSAFAVSAANFTSALMICGLFEYDRARRDGLAEARQGKIRLEHVVRATGVGIWDWRADTGELTVNGRWAGMLGYTLDELAPISIDTWRKLAHPDDLKISDEALFPVLEGRQADYACDVRLRHKSGDWIWVRDTGKAVEHGADGRALRITGTHVDITEMRHAYEAADAAARRYSAIVNSAPDAILTVGPGRKILSFNPEAERLFGYPESDMIGQPLEILIPKSERDGHGAHTDHFLTGDGDTLRAMANWRTVMGVTADGHMVPLMITLSRTHEDGKPIAIAIARDMSASNAQRNMLTELNAKLERKLIEAESANRAKTRFLAAMSHELRTPLNSIIGFADYLRSDHFRDIPDEKKREYLSDISQSGNHLLSLINDLLDLARIEEGRLELHIEPVSVRQSIKQAIRLSKTTIARRSVRIRWLAEPAAMTMMVDRRAILQIVLNLISNAVKFVAERTGRVRIHACRARDGRVQITVEDNGCGIPKERIHELGHPFVQIGNPLLSETKGAGLGLAICRQLVRQMNGDFRIESELGKWTRVTVVVPCA